MSSTVTRRVAACRRGRRRPVRRPTAVRAAVPGVTVRADADANNEETTNSITNEDKTNPEVDETVSINIPQENINLENNVSNDVDLNDSVNFKNEIENINTDRKSPETMVDDLPKHTVTSNDNKDSAIMNDENKLLEPIERDLALAVNKTDSENGPIESETPKEIIQNDDLKDVKEKTKDSIQAVEIFECNGRLEDEKAMTNGEATPGIDEAPDATPEDSMPPSLSEASGDAPSGADSLPPPPSELGDAPQVLDLYSPQTQPTGGDSPPEATAPRAPKNDKKPSVTPPTSASPVATPKPPPVLTPVKNGSDLKLEPPKIDMRFTYPGYPTMPAYPPVYTAPPPSIPPPNRLPIPQGPPPPLRYAEPPPAPPSRFPPVNVPPPNYFAGMPTRGPLPPRGPIPPGPLPPRAYYPPP